MYYLDINLSRYLNTEFVTMEVDGEAEEGIWIPIKRNGLHFGNNKSVHARFMMIDRQPNKFGMSHFVAMYIPDEETRQRFFELGRERNMHYIGYARPSSKYRVGMNAKITPLDEAMEKD